MNDFLFATKEDFEKHMSDGLDVAAIADLYRVPTSAIEMILGDKVNFFVEEGSRAAFKEPSFRAFGVPVSLLARTTFQCAVIIDGYATPHCCGAPVTAKRFAFCYNHALTLLRSQ